MHHCKNKNKPLGLSWCMRNKISFSEHKTPITFQGGRYINIIMRGKGEIKMDATKFPFLTSFSNLSPNNWMDQERRRAACNDLLQFIIQERVEKSTSHDIHNRTHVFFSLSLFSPPPYFFFPVRRHRAWPDPTSRPTPSRLEQRQTGSRACLHACLAATQQWKSDNIIRAPVWGTHAS